MNMLTHAIGYAKLGLLVFTLLPRSKNPYGGSHGVNDATKHCGRIRHWWTQTPDANVAIRTGACSGIFAIDVDPRHGGDKTLAALEAKHGALPETVTARTGGGGRHLLFKHPGWRVKNNNSGKVGHGIDVKGDGGYIVAPPSIHETGVEYQWERAPADVPVAEAPPWLLNLVARRCGTEDTEAISVFSVLSVPTIEDAIRMTLPDDTGQRHRRLFLFARALKAIPDYANAGLKALKPVVRRWWKAALPKIKTKAFDETWADFVGAWPRVHCPLGTGPMDAAVQRARKAVLPKCAKQYETDELRLLVKLCRELQRDARDRPLFLSARTAGEAIGVPKTTAHRYLLVLKADEIIQLVEPGTTTKATRYRYVGK